MSDTPYFNNPEEIENALLLVGDSFDRWMRDQGSVLNTFTIQEVVAHIIVHMRLFLSMDEIARILGSVLAQVEERIKSGDLILEMPDGTEIDFVPAEEYEGREEMRDMLIAVSRGEVFTDDAIEEFLNNELES